uniref:Uncharacterized protein n=1 Tax=Oryza punctata TaxID=4537 RepID=A0A0E0MMR8_ORYPU
MEREMKRGPDLHLPITRREAAGRMRPCSPEGSGRPWRLEGEGRAVEEEAGTGVHASYAKNSKRMLAFSSKRILWHGLQLGHLHGGLTLLEQAREAIITWTEVIK